MFCLSCPVLRCPAITHVAASVSTMTNVLLLELIVSPLYSFDFISPLLPLGRPPPEWAGTTPSPEDISTAVEHGHAALRERRALESNRKPLAQDTPANRAQRAASTSAAVKPMADAAYAAEQATRALLNG